MDKHEQAQRFAEIILETGLKGHWDMVGDAAFKGVAHDAWLLADAMQAEAEKRKEEKKKELYSILAEKTHNCHLQGCTTPARPFLKKE